MRREDFFEVLGELDNGIVKEAETPAKKKLNRKALRTAALAAMLAAALIVPATAHVMETVRYNAAVEYLRALGIDAEDLSDYSREEIIRAVEEEKAEEAEGVIDGLRAKDGPTEIPEEPTNVTSEQVRRLTPSMTVSDVTEELGVTVDIGSGICILVYKVDGVYTLNIPFAGNRAQLGVCGEDLLKALQPIEQP